MACGCGKKKTAMEIQAESETVRKLAANREQRRQERLRRAREQQIADADKVKAASGQLDPVSVS